jgi:hypothetical protein
MAQSSSLDGCVSRGLDETAGILHLSRREPAWMNLALVVVAGVLVWLATIWL